MMFWRSVCQRRIRANKVGAKDAPAASKSKSRMLLPHVTTALLCALISPVLLRYLVLPKLVARSEPLDFTFHTCDDQLSGVCSYPESVLNFEESSLMLTPGYYYGFDLTLEFFDTEQNRRLGVFLVQVSAFDGEGKSLGVYKKPLLFKQSLLGSTYTWIRNWVFLPLYLVGYFSRSDVTHVIHFTNQFYEAYDRPTSVIKIQLQNRNVQVAFATIDIYAQVGLSGYFLTNFPILSTIVVFFTSIFVYGSFFIAYWLFVRHWYKRH